MPDYNGVLTEDERQKIDDWIKKNWHIRNCPICRHQNWILADHVVMPILYSEYGITSSASGYPQIMIICKNCGYTLCFNAITMGIIGGTLNGR